MDQWDSVLNRVLSAILPGAVRRGGVGSATGRQMSASGYQHGSDVMLVYLAHRSLPDDGPHDPPFST